MSLLSLKLMKLSFVFLALLLPLLMTSYARANEKIKLLSPAEPVCISKAKVDLRKGPGKKNAISWTVGKNMPFLKIAEGRDKQNSKWFQVRDLDGQKHWLRPGDITSKVNCAVIRTKKAKLRQGPGANFPEAELASVDRYTPFKKIDRDGDWVLLQDDYQGQYWANESSLWIPALRASVAF